MLFTSYTVAINPSQKDEDLSVLYAGRSQTEPSHTVGPHVLDHYLIHYVISGEGTFKCRGNMYNLKRGASFVIFPGELVAYESDGKNPWKYRWVAVKGPSVDERFADLGITPEHPIIQSSSPARTQVLFYKILQILRNANAATNLEATAYFLMILGDFAKNQSLNIPEQFEQKTQSQIQVEQAIRWLTLQHSSPISIDKMAQSLGYHRTYLSKIFKTHTGMSPKEFLLKIRMERAKNLLDEPLTIKEVANSVGFSDSLYFSKQFKKWYGLSPSEYKQQ